jgi:endonuclease YncB( thermonuclease family)
MKRPLWRSLLDAAKFLALFIIVLLVLQRYGVVDIMPGQVTVIDGDSLREGKTELRLYGIDAPEYRQTCIDQAHIEYACGKRAADALRQLVKQGELKCRELDIDRYGRSVSTCNIGTMDVNQAIVAQGWAIAFTQFGTDYVSTEKTARQNKLGLWAGTFELPSIYRQRLRNMNGDVAALQDVPPD